MRTAPYKTITAALLGSTLLAGAASAESLADLVDQVSPSVVTILASQNARAEREMRVPEGTPFEDFFRNFDGPQGMPRFEQGPQPVQGLGSGFVFAADGYIVTNNHVVDGADEITVRLDDDREFPAEVIGTDPQSDLALLHIDATGLVALTLGDSDAMRVGDDVMAVGNPFGLGGTVTSGIISAKGRDINSGPYVDYLQTDAAINRGNSGGPLFNMDGQVIGVNTSIFSPSGGSVGIGFAVPSNIVSNVVAQLQSDGTFDRGWLGVSIQQVTPAIAAALGLADAQGALVAGVLPESPSEGVLKAGDVILSLDGATVGESRDLPTIVAATAPGNASTISVMRDGKTIDLPITIGKLPVEQVVMNTANPSPKDESASTRLGATLSSLTPDIIQGLELPQDVTGAIITSLQSGGPAEAAGLQVGDVIVKAGSTDITSPEELNAVLADLDGDKTLLLVNRNGNPFFVGVSL